MEYSKLVAVSGISGLFELLSSKADGGVGVRQLDLESLRNFLISMLGPHLGPPKILRTGPKECEQHLNVKAGCQSATKRI